MEPPENGLALRRSRHFTAKTGERGPSRRIGNVKGWPRGASDSEYEYDRPAPHAEGVPWLIVLVAHGGVRRLVYPSAFRRAPPRMLPLNSQCSSIAELNSGPPNMLRIYSLRCNRCGDPTFI